MRRALVWINIVLTVPFGVLALVIPAPVFAQFGVQLDAGGSLVAQGYGATLVAYGLLLYFLRGMANTMEARALFYSMFVFNAIEAFIQGVAGARGVAAPIIFGNVVVHSIVAVLCIVSYLQREARQQA